MIYPAVPVLISSQPLTANSQEKHLAPVIDGNTETGAHVRRSICNLICLRHLIRSKAVTNRIFFSKELFLAAKCSPQNHSVSLPLAFSCLYTFSLSAIYSKNLQATHTGKLLTLSNLLQPPMKKNNLKIQFHPLSEDPVQKYFFCCNKKIFLQTPVERIFIYNFQTPLLTK